MWNSSRNSIFSKIEKFKLPPLHEYHPQSAASNRLWPPSRLCEYNIMWMYHVNISCEYIMWIFCSHYITFTCLSQPLSINNFCHAVSFSPAYSSFHHLIKCPFVKCVANRLPIRSPTMALVCVLPPAFQSGPPRWHFQTQQKASSTQTTSDPVPHDRTNGALPRLTAEFERDLVYSWRYGR